RRRALGGAADAGPGGDPALDAVGPGSQEAAQARQPRARDRRDELERPPLVRDEVERAPLVRDEVGRHEVERDEVERGRVGRRQLSRFALPALASAIAFAAVALFVFVVRDIPGYELGPHIPWWALAAA